MLSSERSESVLWLAASGIDVDRGAHGAGCAVCVGADSGHGPAVQYGCSGTNGAQPEGAFFNFINWIGNVVAPVGAGGAVFGSIVAFMSGRHMGRWLIAAAALLAVSGLTRLLEFWVLQGTGGVS